MSTSALHFIRRQTIELQLSSRKDAYRRQKAVSELYQQEVIAHLGPVFDKLVGEGEVLRIPRIEIDLGSISAQTFERDFVEQCRIAVQKAVKEALAEARMRSLGASTGNEQLPGIDEAAQLFSAEKSKLELLVQFLKSGTLPPPWHRMSKAEISLLWEELLAKQAKAVWETVGRLITRSKPALERLTQQMPPGWIRALLKNAPGAEEPDNFSTSQTKIRRVEEAFNSHQGNPSLPDWWSALPLEIREQIAKLLTIHTDQGAGQLSAKLWQKLQQIVLAQALKEQRKLDNETIKRLENILSPMPYSMKSKTEDSRDATVQDESEHNAERQKQIEEKVYIGMAGLVILHPFLPTLFERLEWVKEDMWISEEIQTTAVHLLGYAATGRQKFSEHELVMAKVLCGMELGFPLDSLHLPLSEDPNDQINILLDSILQHWSALGNSSVEALRDSFLQRNGVLQFMEESIQLQVERKTIDILIDQLPWGVGVIKLPWMKRKMIVNW
ncbi:MAG: contractile injection system tape measure protein [Bacteroidota bacterium]